MNGKYLIYSGILFLGITVMLIKRYKTIKEEKIPNELQDKSQCKALTSAGTRCKRKSLPYSEFCWQHKN
jgi:hypothetical protein